MIKSWNDKKYHAKMRRNAIDVVEHRAGVFTDVQTEVEPLIRGLAAAAYTGGYHVGEVSKGLKTLVGNFHPLARVGNG